MKRALGVGIFVLLLLVLPTGLLRVDAPPAAAAVTTTPWNVTRGTVPRAATLARLLGGAVGPQQVQQLVEAARPVHNLARLGVGQPWALAVSPDGALQAFSYGIDELRTLRVLRHEQGLRTELVERSYETRVATVAGEIRSSLFEAVTATGEQDQLALDLAEIFAWDVDFNTEIQKGDGFRLAVEKLSLDGRFVRYGRILAAEFRRGERSLAAVRFDREGDVGGFYAPDGSPLRKAFLRSPLKFSRISSGFSRARFHPILGKYTAHLGVDYAAPVGTPVQAASAGVVASAGWMGGYGKTVRLRHANGFETLYGHLSRIDVRAGQRVAQGERVGAVGSTGLSTGPHLDYRMVRDGAFVNPLRVQLPPAEPIPDAERAAFEAVREQALALLPPAAAPTQAAALSVPAGQGPSR